MGGRSWFCAVCAHSWLAKVAASTSNRRRVHQSREREPARMSDESSPTLTIAAPAAVALAPQRFRTSAPAKDWPWFAESLLKRRRLRRFDLRLIADMKLYNCYFMRRNVK
jgi:hypothetical protein